jgi:hypothetical protein
VTSDTPTSSAPIPASRPKYGERPAPLPPELRFGFICIPVIDEIRTKKPLGGEGIRKSAKDARIHASEKSARFHSADKGALKIIAGNLLKMIGALAAVFTQAGNSRGILPACVERR